jgi:hypothetical protein
VGVELRFGVPSVPAAADIGLRSLVAGPPRPGSVVAMLTDALHVTVDGKLLVICGPTAVRLPGSVTVAEPLQDVLDLDGLDPVVVGTGRVRVGAVTFEIRRWTASPHPRLRDVAAAARRSKQVAELLPLLPSPVDDRTLAFHAALLTAMHGRGNADLNTAVARLVGLGPGLTPAGDDVLAGALIALHAAENPWHHVLAAAIATDRLRTTALSAALLDASATGCCIPQVARFVAALDGRADVEPALAALLTVGHSSGAALATGIAIALAAVDAGHGSKESAA